jgi:hypothetical protein
MCVYYLLVLFNKFNLIFIQFTRITIVVLMIVILVFIPFQLISNRVNLSIIRYFLFFIWYNILNNSLIRKTQHKPVLFFIVIKII